MVYYAIKQPILLAIKFRDNTIAPIIPHTVPGDLVRIVLKPTVTTGEIQQAKFNFGSGQPLPVQYFQLVDSLRSCRRILDYLKDLFSAALGVSMKKGQLAIAEIGEWLLATVGLVFLGSIHNCLHWYSAWHPDCGSGRFTDSPYNFSENWYRELPKRGKEK